MNELLKERGFRMKAVVAASGIPSTTFYRWLDNPSIRELIKISDFTHIPVTEFVECYRPAPGAIDTGREGGEQN